MAGGIPSNWLLPALEDYYAKNPLNRHPFDVRDAEVKVPRAHVLRLSEAHRQQLREKEALLAWRAGPGGMHVKKLLQQKEALENALQAAAERAVVPTGDAVQEHRLVECKAEKVEHLRLLVRDVQRDIRELEEEIGLLRRVIVDEGNWLAEGELGAILLIEFRVVGVSGEDVASFHKLQGLVRSVVSEVLGLPAETRSACAYRHHLQQVVTVCVYYRLPEYIRVDKHPLRRLRQVIRNVIRSGELRKAIERRSRAAAPLEVVQFLRPQLQDGIIAPVPELFPTSLPLGIVAEECIPNRFRVTRLDDNSWAQLIGVRPEDVVIFADGDAVYAKRHEDLAPQVMRKRPVTLYAARYNSKATRLWDEDSAAFVIQSRFHEGPRTRFGLWGALDGLKQDFTRYLVVPVGVGDIGIDISGKPPGRIVVKKVEPGSWAHLNDISPPDEIVTLNGACVLDMNPGEFETLLGYTRPLEIGIITAGGAEKVRKKDPSDRRRLAMHLAELAGLQLDYKAWRAEEERRRREEEEAERQRRALEEERRLAAEREAARAREKQEKEDRRRAAIEEIDRRKAAKLEAKRLKAKRKEDERRRRQREKEEHRRRAEEAKEARRRKREEARAAWIKAEEERVRAEEEELRRQAEEAERKKEREEEEARRKADEELAKQESSKSKGKGKRNRWSLDVEAEVAKYTSKQQELKQQDRTGLRGAFNAGFERIFGKDRVVGNEASAGRPRPKPKGKGKGKGKAKAKPKPKPKPAPRPPPEDSPSPTPSPSSSSSPPPSPSSSTSSPTPRLPPSPSSSTPMPTPPPTPPPPRPPSPPSPSSSSSTSAASTPEPPRPDSIIAIDTYNILATRADQALGVVLSNPPPKQPIVTAVPRNTLAYHSGVLPGDRLVAMNGIRVNEMSTRQFNKMLKHTRPLQLTFSRDTRAAEVSAFEHVQAFFQGRNIDVTHHEERDAARRAARGPAPDAAASKLQAAWRGHKVRKSLRGRRGKSRASDADRAAKREAELRAAKERRREEADAFLAGTTDDAPRRGADDVPRLSGVRFVSAGARARLHAAVEDDAEEGRAFEVRVAQGVARLGFRPSGVPPRRMFVEDLEPYSWAVRNGILVGHELIAVDGRPIGLFSRQELVNTMPKRPLRLMFRGTQGRTGEEGFGHSSSRAPRMAAGEAASRAEALADAVAAGDRVPRPLQLPGAPLGIARFDVVAGAQDLDLGFLPSGFPPDEVHVAKAWGFAHDNFVSAGDRLVGVDGHDVAGLERKAFKAVMREKRPLQLTFEFETTLAPGVRALYASGADTAAGFATRPTAPAVVTRVDAGSWADVQGLAVGDELLEVGGASVAEMAPEAIFDSLRRRPMRFVFERPAEGGAKSRSFVRTVYDVDGKLGFQWSRPPGDIVVTKVAPGSWAERSGIAVGLALVRVDGVDTATLTAEGLQATMRQRPLEMAFERRKKARRPPQESSDFVNWAYGFFAGPEDDG